VDSLLVAVASIVSSFPFDAHKDVRFAVDLLSGDIE
jgi:hypothetical protein